MSAPLPEIATPTCTADLAQRLAECREIVRETGSTTATQTAILQNYELTRKATA